MISKIANLQMRPILLETTAALQGKLYSIYTLLRSVPSPNPNLPGLYSQISRSLAMWRWLL